MVTLGGVVLGYDIIWTDRHQSDGVSTITPTAGGGHDYCTSKTVGHPYPLKLLTNKVG